MMIMADCIVVIHDDVVQQLGGVSLELYGCYANVFVVGFIGSQA